MPGWGWLSRAGVPVPGEVICTLNHPLRALPTGLQTRPLRAHLLPHQGLSRGIPARPGKTPSGIPSTGTPTGAPCLGLDKKGTRPRFLPRPWGNTEKGRDWGSREDPWSARAHQEPGGPLHPLPKLQRRQRLGRRWEPGPALLPPPDGGQPFAYLLLPVGCGPRSSRPSTETRGAGARSYRVRTRHLPHPSLPHPAPFPTPTPPPTPNPARRPTPDPACPGTSGRPLAGLASTCPGRRAWARRPALPPRPCDSRAAGFPVQQYNQGGTGGERPAELPPGLGLGCGCERQSPVSWLPVPSGPGQRLTSKDAIPSPALPGILGHTWLSPGRKRPRG
uniref:basic proline-rich protein-like n=1 Tax=Macaca mulatta TaxID=9544 RepID=UPI0010A267E9|nr:basic proline-rich protein-like [Macaca mulatta]